MKLVVTLKKYCISLELNIVESVSGKVHHSKKYIICTYTFIKCLSGEEDSAG